MHPSKKEVLDGQACFNLIRFIEQIYIKYMFYKCKYKLRCVFWFLFHKNVTVTFLCSGFNY